MFHKRKNPDSVTGVRVDDQCLRVIPGHRVTVPDEHGVASEKMAKDLHVGDCVMVSHGSPKPITAILPLIERSLVFAFTFEPDVPVQSYFPPTVKILSFGQTPRTPERTRRGMKSRRPDDILSIPDTEPGLYQD